MLPNPVHKVCHRVPLGVEAIVVEYFLVTVGRGPVQLDPGAAGNILPSDPHGARGDAPIRDERIVEAQHFVDRRFHFLVGGGA